MGIHKNTNTKYKIQNTKFLFTLDNYNWENQPFRNEQASPLNTVSSITGHNIHITRTHAKKDNINKGSSMDGKNLNPKVI